MRRSLSPSSPAVSTPRAGAHSADQRQQRTEAVYALCVLATGILLLVTAV